MLQNQEVKLCQSCIERGFNPPQPASREWQTGIYYCDDCFNAVINNLTNIAPGEVLRVLDDKTDKTDKTEKAEKKNIPVLDQIYETLKIPKELQFDKVDTVCRNHVQIFNFHAPAVVNRSLESLQEEIEQLGMSLFHIKYKMEPLEWQISKLKEEKRKERGLNVSDSREAYSRPKKTSTVKTSQEEREAKKLGMKLEEYREMIKMGQEKEKKARERKFNILAGNCPECGGAFPCVQHP